ncbi:MAG TPA: helix-turn-helix transcriptional regulator [Ilumatobacteraceae bacterium]|nr:helix-turn-helix transcriptional regulator [Ilumatobacteraceae bacterium]HRB04096.1 helix-turn-helix transcriptional regulator [Ilumatobacteraceae bacterium]
MTKTYTPGVVLAQRVTEMRGRLQWSQDELARRMTAYGLPWSRTTVAKVESESRQVTVDEFVALALVFGVTPAALLTLRDSDAVLNVTPNTQTPVRNVWSWHTGSLPMGGSVPSDMVSVSESLDLHRRHYEAAPNHIAEGERILPGARRLAATAAGVVGIASWPNNMPYLASLLNEVIRQAKALAADAQQMGGEK